MIAGRSPKGEGTRPPLGPRARPEGPHSSAVAPLPLRSSPGRVSGWLAEQRRRLAARGDSAAKIAERLAKAEHEEPIGRALADHLVVNDDLDRAVDEIGRLIETARKEPRPAS